ncbi:hypothetical protein V7139_31870 [Neobacillus drentensis]
MGLRLLNQSVTVEGVISSFSANFLYVPLYSFTMYSSPIIFTPVEYRRQLAA